MKVGKDEWHPVFGIKKWKGRERRERFGRIDYKCHAFSQQSFMP